MSKILITAPMTEADLKRIGNHFDEIVYEPWDKRGRFLEPGELSAMLVREKPDALITERETVGKDVLDKYHDLSFIGDCRGTPVNVDAQEAARYGIALMHTPARNAQAVAEMTLAETIVFLRNAVPAREWLLEGGWVKGVSPYTNYRGNELKYKKVGLVGLGAVARALVRLLKAFDCEISFYDPYVNEYEGLKKCGLEEIFSENDIVSVHLPVTDETRGLIGKELLSLLKPHAVLVNSSRSAVIKTEELIALLKAESFRGFVTDVFDSEPPDSSALELASLPNVLATPHIYGASEEVADWQSRIMADRVDAWFSDRNKAEFVYNYKLMS